MGAAKIATFIPSIFGAGSYRVPVGCDRGAAARPGAQRAVYSFCFLSGFMGLRGTGSAALAWLGRTAGRDRANPPPHGDAKQAERAGARGAAAARGRGSRSEAQAEGRRSRAEETERVGAP